MLAGNLPTLHVHATPFVSKACLSFQLKLLFLRKEHGLCSLGWIVLLFLLYMYLGLEIISKILV